MPSTSTSTPPPAPTPTPTFTAVRRPGNPLTPVLLEARVQTAGTLISTLLALGLLATEGPTIEAVGAALLIGAGIAALRFWLRTRDLRRLLKTFHEPLSADRREPLWQIVARQLPEDVVLVAFVSAVVFWGDVDAEVLVGAAGLLVGVAVSSISTPRAIARIQQTVGGELFYQRQPWRVELWKGDGSRGPRVVILVDDADPERWGPQQH